MQVFKEKELLLQCCAVSSMLIFTDGHGYATSPRSRVELARAAGLEGCPHCGIVGPPAPWTESNLSDGMRLTDDPICDAESTLPLSWYNGNPFCNPQAVTPAEAILNEGTPFGIWGTQQRNGGNGDVFLNYNRPYAGFYGESVEGIYEPGEVVDVEWCANTDHGGVYTWRLCHNETIVNWFLEADRILTVDEARVAEDCFQEGTL